MNGLAGRQRQAATLRLHCPLITQRPGTNKDCVRLNDNDIKFLNCASFSTEHALLLSSSNTSKTASFQT